MTRWEGKTVARTCSWCQAPMTDEDAEAIRLDPEITLTHTICPACRALHFAWLEEEGML